MDIRIDLMQLTHLPEVLDIENLCFRNPWSWQSFNYEISENPRALYLVALVGQKVVGYVGTWLIFDEAHITNLAVHPDWQKKGIGGMLVTTLIKMGELHNISHFTLEVRVTNLNAQRLYKKLGFSEAGLRKKYYQDNQEDAIIMWKHLK